MESSILIIKWNLLCIKLLLIESVAASNLMWAGPDKNILCHCAGNGCLGDGTCKPGVPCVTGYFGHACQYVDGAQGVAQSYPELTDGSDATCITRRDLDLVTIATAKTNARYIRLVFKKNYNPNNLVLKVESLDPSSTFDCNGSAVYVSRTIMDFYCRDVVKIDRVIINGSSVPYLCSVHVSRGRNLALKAEVKMSSHFSKTEFLQEGAVDGNRAPGSDTCIHSGKEETYPELNVTFPTQVILDWIFIENRKNFIQRLKHFQLISYGPAGQEVMFYNDTESPRLTVVVEHPYPLEPISQVTLRAVAKSPPNYNSTILNICELETYGDCPAGKYGLKCAHPCRASCLSEICTVEGYCYECAESSASGLFCNQSCSENCAEIQACDLNSSCFFGCRPTFYNHDCSKSCSEYCAGSKFCFINGTCESGCVAGYYGLDCTEECGENCANEKQCDILTGACTYGCAPSFYGPHCEMNCSKSCANDGSCYSNATCVHGCSGPFYTFNCHKDCGENCAKDRHCNIQTGACTHGCAPSFYGPNCSKSCSSNCADDGSCFMNETCQHGCLSSFYGSDCKKSCSENCAEDKQCHVQTGACSRGCIPSFYGATCDKKCSEYCAGDRKCFIDGTCQNGCEPKYYGLDCTKSCSKNCAGDGTCYRNATCIFGCHRPYYEDDCSKNADCSDTCAGDGNCYANGTCKHGCLTAFTGHNCSENCSENCAQDKTCSMNGTCSNGCAPMFYGSSCSQTCSLSCGGDGSCYRDGRCASGCVPSYYGADCSTLCSENCAANRSCHMMNGSCAFGCVPGFYGADCSKQCSEKCAGNGECNMKGKCLFGCLGPFFGDSCTKPCNDNCAENKTCFMNGTCKFGCLASFYGEQCTKMCSEKCAGDKSCSTRDGKCLHGCVAPFYGEFCTKNPFLNPYCIGGLANLNHICEHGCVPPYIGDGCNLLGLPRDRSPSKTWACHCNDASCIGEKESCMSVDSCLVGWFGYSCNYRDIVASAKVTNKSLNDNNINTCFEAANNTVSAEWNEIRKISWLWITFDNKAVVDLFTVTYAAGKNIFVCKKPSIRNITSTQQTLQLDCGELYQVQTLTIRWIGNGSICSLSVSEGQDMAYYSKVLLASNLIAKQTIYSLTNGDINERHCITVYHNENDVLDFKLYSTALITSIVIHPDFMKDVNATFSLILSLNLKSVYNFSVSLDKGAPYIITVPYSEEVSEVQLAITEGQADICEVEILGECAAPYYGHRCEGICHFTCWKDRCAHDGQCFECSRGRFGEFCLEFNSTFANLTSIGSLFQVKSIQWSNVLITAASILICITCISAVYKCMIVKKENLQNDHVSES